MSWELAVVGGFIGIALIQAYLSSKFPEEHAGLQFMFLGVSISTLTAATWVISLIVHGNNADIETIANAMLVVMVIVMITTIAYFIINFLVKRLNMLGTKPGEADDEEGYLRA